MANGECGEYGVNAVQHVMEPELATDIARARNVVVLTVTVHQVPVHRQSPVAVLVVQVCDAIVYFFVSC